MASSQQELIREIEAHRARIVELEAEMAAAGAVPLSTWPPQGFYLTYYIVAGAILGILGSLTSFLFNVFGSLVVDQDPYYFLRVYGTVFLGEAALKTTDLNFFMLVAVVHFSVGAMAGAVFHVWINRFGPQLPRQQIAAGAVYGLLMWIVNFYLVLLWLEPALVGQAYVLQLMPAWVAALTHVVFGLTLGVLQPLGRFVPYRVAEAG
jgi:hypothetical protein